ncbi:REDY-like protein HapK [Erythrobacter sp. HL-111]|uniref:REDY-like protein HapK n=1 Tax=Erythrobacter sp. HL-111 TaxID=1798193 RepID=UPI0006DB831E|nr:REDY-like protein HapK [Erythrobacter sp. HL-111]KPP94906.1 MAG: REDY-like protein HapK [Erythrobacteraceae bacterium HL-111]SDS90694.1 REDY-like protein HapK [Erythrobacter sp. HL-111]
MRIICLFNLKPGTSVAEYEEWAKTRDIPAVNALGSVTSFTVHRSVGVFGDENAKPHFDYIEVIDVTGMDEFVADISTEDFQAAAAPFQGFADAPQFILTEDL